TIARNLTSIASIEVASTCDAARRTIGEHSKPADAFDAAILDVRLPDGSGLDLLPLLGSSPRPTPTLVVTGDVTPEIARAAFAWQASYMIKPGSREDLRTFVMRARVASRSGSIVLAAEAIAAASAALARE